MATFGDVTSDGYDHSYSYGISICIFVLTMLLVTVILLNALIALLNDSYQRIQQGKTNYILKEKCHLILE